MAAILVPPQEILVKVLDHVHTADLPKTRLVCKDFETASNPRFARESLAKRCHAMSCESISTMDEITSHTYFGPFVKTINLNCVRTADRYSLKQYDNAISGMSFEDDAKETIEETCAKHRKIVRIIQNITRYHGKVNIGVCFENNEKHQPCFGLGKLMATTGGGGSNAKRAVYSPAHLKNNLKALMRICKQQDCPIDRIEVDLGSYTSVCTDRERPILGCRTLYSDLQEIYKDSIVPDVSLSIESRIGPFHSMSNAYDHVSHSFKATCKLVRLDLAYKGKMGYLRIDPKWLAATVVTQLELDSAEFGLYPNHGSVYIHQWSNQLEELTLRNLGLHGERNYSTFMTCFANLPALKKVYFSQLTAYKRFIPEVGEDQYADFLDIVLYFAEGPHLKQRLLDLAARVRADEVAWDSLPDDLRKYTKGLGAKIVNEPGAEEESSKKDESEAKLGTKGENFVISQPKSTPRAAAFITSALHGVKRKRATTDDQPNGHLCYDVLHFTAGRQRPRNIYYPTKTHEDLNFIPQKPRPDTKASKVVSFKIPKHMRKDVSEILNSDEVVSTTPVATPKTEHERESSNVMVASGELVTAADKDLSQVPAALEEKALHVRKHSNVSDTSLSNLSDETLEFVAQAKDRYILEEIQGLGDTDDWADKLCARINRISLRGGQKETAHIIQHGSIIFKGAVRVETSETDDWADEIGWDLDQVLKKHSKMT